LLGGYLGKTLWIDLSENKLSIKKYPDEILEKYIGGYGLGAKILYDELEKGINPLGEKNILGFCSGPLTGTPAIEGNRFMVICKSPLTGGIGEANSGGSFGPYLKFSGYDAVFFKGKADKPKYLFIDNGEAKLIDAEDLWGKDTTETERQLKEKHGKDCRIASIGPAGENISLISAIIHDGRAAARSGVGAVMGSKRIKAVIVKGNQEIPLDDSEAVKKVKRKYIKMPSREYEPLSNTGTIGILSTSIMSGDAPVKNWKGAGLTDFPQGIENFESSKVMEYQSKKIGCWRCTIACSGKMEVEDGPYKIKSKKVEYESAAAFGPLILNADFESIIYINDMCNRLGFDTISAGTVFAFAMECTEKNLFDDDQLKIEWGDAEKVIELLPKLARREGSTNILTDGVKKAAEKIGEGSENFAVHVNGQELPFHDPRFQPGMATTYATEPTPGRHCPCEWILPPGLDFPDDFDKYSPHDKAYWQKRMTSQMQMINASGLCQFGYYSYPYEAWPQFLEAVTGVDYSIEKFEKTGERILNLRHAFNLREGINPLEYKFPERAIGIPPLEDGNTKGITVDLETQIKEYFVELNWDLKTSYPAEEKLQELELFQIAKDLY
jgi:aldehyde:ferredoxin oxidoreductase